MSSAMCMTAADKLFGTVVDQAGGGWGGAGARAGGAAADENQDEHDAPATPSYPPYLNGNGNNGFPDVVGSVGIASMRLVWTSCCRIQADQRETAQAVLDRLRI